MRPPANDRVSASTRNCARMLRGLAPTAMRTPISRVRSVTDTSMMFMMPMPPTRSETAAMLASSVVSVLVPCSWALAISVRLRIEKSSSVPGRGGAGRAAGCVICASARAVPAGEVAPTKITPAMNCCSPPWILVWNVLSGMNAASS